MLLNVKYLVVCQLRLRSRSIFSIIISLKFKFPDYEEAGSVVIAGETSMSPCKSV